MRNLYIQIRTKLVSNFMDSMIDSMVRWSCSEINKDNGLLRMKVLVT